jgi:hypothetical protein
MLGGHHDLILWFPGFQVFGFCCNHRFSHFYIHFSLSRVAVASLFVVPVYLLKEYSKLTSITVGTAVTIFISDGNLQCVSGT